MLQAVGGTSTRERAPRDAFNPISIIFGGHQGSLAGCCVGVEHFWSEFILSTDESVHVAVEETRQRVTEETASTDSLTGEEVGTGFVHCQAHPALW